jgi:ubiquitin-conjugating enzyme E2 S
MMLVDEDEDLESPWMSSSEQNIQANANRSRSPHRKQVKLSLLNRGLNASGRLRDDLQIYEDVPEITTQDVSRRLSGDGKENRESDLAVLGLKERCEMQAAKTVTPLSAGTAQIRPASSLASSAAPSKVSKVSAGVRKVSSGAGKTKPRIGVRRL